jgi:hypothetical protein
MTGNALTSSRTAGLRRASLAALVDQGHASASMTMAILTGAGLLCYGICLYLLGSRPDRADAS